MKMLSLSMLVVVAVFAGDPPAATQEFKSPVQIRVVLNPGAEWISVGGEIDRIYCEEVRFTELRYRVKDGQLQVRYKLQNASGADVLVDVNFAAGGALRRVRGLNLEDASRDNDTVTLPLPAAGSALEIMLGVRKND